MAGRVEAGSWGMLYEGETRFLTAALCGREHDDRVQRDRHVDALLAWKAHQVGIQNPVDCLHVQDMRVQNVAHNQITGRANTQLTTNAHTTHHMLCMIDSTLVRKRFN